MRRRARIVDRTTGPCCRERIAVGLAVALLPLLSTVPARAGEDDITAGANGDVNGDQERNLSDAVYLLNSLFLGGTPPVPCARRAALPATGQTICRGWRGAGIPCDGAECPGQDGLYRSGCPSDGRFVAQDDGTVTDKCTGLTWQQESAGSSDGAGGDGALHDWCAALAYCESLELAGHGDWRLPDVRELQSIVDYGLEHPEIHPFFDTHQSSGVYWSSTPLAGHPGSAWSVLIDVGNEHDVGGLISPAEKTSQHRVRAVRGGDGSTGVGAAGNGDVNGDGERNLSDPVYLLNWLFRAGPAPVPCRGDGHAGGLPDTGQEICSDSDGNVIDCASGTCEGQDGSHATGCSPQGRFVDNGDGTVTDNCTGLMWRQDSDVSGDGVFGPADLLHWCAALEYCEKLEFSGHDDWRLPNIRELQSIVDYGQREPALDERFRAFPFASWSSTSFAGNPSFAWVVYLGFGGDVSVDDKWGGFLVRAVRSDSTP